MCQLIQCGQTACGIPVNSPALTEIPTSTPVPTEEAVISPTVVPEIIGISEERKELKQQVLQKIADGTYSELDNKSDECAEMIYTIIKAEHQRTIYTSQIIEKFI